jgi:uncharacterized lipoprotein YddW (UPF0748 family)
MHKFACMKKYTLFYILLFQTLHLIAQPKYEFRAVWIATVNNIDWPVRGMVNVDSQKNEYIRQLELHKKNGMNAVIVQVRPAADAFYPSSYEPWSQWLTGTQGKPPLPYYDPLEFLIREAHKRGMEFHAWCNPYRADFKIGASSIAPAHITRLHPEWFVDYGGLRYFDPGNKNAQKFVVDVIADIVSRYDIDAIHMDDYFYPYRIKGKEFPDSLSYALSGSKLNKEDWRRSNVDSIIRQLSIAIKRENTYCRFGISPFSVWRNRDKDPEGSDSQAAQTNFDDLYADILLWLKNGWIDYVAPQLYLEIGHPKIAYEKLLDWWSKHSYGRQVYIGHGIYRAGGNEPVNAAWKNPAELPNQLRLLRQTPNIQGSIYFSSKWFDINPNGWNDSLQNNYYKFPALIPPMDWIDTVKPPSPKIQLLKDGDDLKLIISPYLAANQLKYFIVFVNETSEDPGKRTAASILKIMMPDENQIILPSSVSGYLLSVVAVSKTNVESESTTIAVPIF